MKSNETFGSAVSEDVIKIIKARESFFKKSPKTPRDHSLINSNTAWVKLRSSINTISKDDQNKLLKDVNGKETIKGKAEKAKNFILFNGKVTAEGNNQIGIPKGVKVPGADEGNYAYDWNEKLGYRPIPGITNFKVASKNTYGTLQQAEVDFVVWSKEDLEKAELLFFRPGYTVLLEWGHSIFVNEDEECVEVREDTFTIPDKTFFADGNTPEKIEEELERKREELGYSYDGLFGYITNFNWSYRADGGYDCSIRIVSRGQVLDSIKTGTTEDTIEDTEEKIEKTKEHRKSIWHAIFQAIENKSGPEIDGKAAIDYYYRPKIGSKLKKDFKAFGYNLDIADGKTAYWLNEDEIKLRYIPLYAVLDIFNQFVALKNPETDGRFCEFVLENENEYLTFPAHYSIDPLVAVLPKIPTGETKDFIIKKNDLHQKMASFASGNENKIHFIMVSTHFIKSQIDNVIDSAGTDGIGVLDILQGILEGINTAFGGINELDISTISNGNHILVDRKNPQSKNPLPTIELTGLSTTVTNIDLSSKISSQIAAQVSIAAQGSTGNYQDNVAAILKWNAGAIDRVMPIKRPTDEAQNVDDQEKKQKTFIEDLTEVYEDFNEWDADYLSDTWMELKGANTAYIKRLYRESIAKKDKPIVEGVVPVELTIKMLGITGFKVGLSFKIKPGILPSKYDDFAYIITGLENDIGTDNKWYTTIKTQFYNVS